MNDFWSRLCTQCELVFEPVQRGMHRYILAPVRGGLDHLEPISAALEHTRSRRILQISIFPALLIVTYVVGVELVSEGYALRTYAGTLIMFLAYSIIFVPLERLIPFSRNWIKDDDVTSDILVFLSGRVWFGLITLPLQLALLSLTVQSMVPVIGQAIWPAHWPVLIQVVLLLFVLDFFNYWYHRWSHSSTLLWRLHAVHHSAKRLYWFNSLRLHPVQIMIGSLIWAIPLAFVQAPVEVVFVAGLLSRTLGRLQHTNMDLVLGPLDYVFSSPGVHRLHHSTREGEGRCNYGLDFMIWDQLFGTFLLPKGGQKGDQIGLIGCPDYPTSFSGLMMAPINHKQLLSESDPTPRQRQQEA